MSDPAILGAIGTILTALSGAVAHLWRQNRAIMKGQIEWRDKRIEQLEKEADKDEAKILDLERRIGNLEKDKAVMEARFLAFRSSHDSSPLPMWIKDAEGKVLACNRAYEVLFLRPRGYTLNDYLGRTDADVWPSHVAEQFRENDLSVLRDREILDTRENCTNAQGREIPVRVIKYPRTIDGIEEPIGVAGIAILDDIRGAAFHGA